MVVRALLLSRVGWMVSAWRRAAAALVEGLLDQGKLPLERLVAHDPRVCAEFITRGTVSLFAIHGSRRAVAEQSVKNRRIENPETRIRARFVFMVQRFQFTELELSFSSAFACF